jgi:predicted transglutaminase-like cysteine proteinase
MGRAMVGVAVLAAGVLCGCATTPGTMPLASVMPQAAVPAPVPAGFLSFCMRFAGQCDAAPGAASTIALDEQSWRTLSRVNRDVNDSIWPEEDEVHYGRAEYWTIPTDGYGDCDDYAVTKRKDLLDAGFPVAALRLAVVMTPAAERHAVLTVATDKGDLVLDNLSNDIHAWNTTGFTWIERQDSANPRNWVSLQPVMAQQSAGLPTATAR